MGNTLITWNEADFNWNLAPGEQNTNSSVIPYTWDEVLLVQEVIGVASGDEILWQVDKLDPEKKKRFIRLVCKVKGIETYSGQKTIKDKIEITADDIKLVIKEVLNVDLTVENIKI